MSKLRFATYLVAAALVAGSAFGQTPQTGMSGTRPAAAPAPAAKPAATPAAPAATTAATPKAPLLDINSASKQELDALPGIGAARSEAIIKGRPYKGKDDLLRKKIIPSNVYESIKDQIIAKQS